MTKSIDRGLAKFLAESKVKHRVYHGTMSDVKEFKTPAYFGGKEVANQFADPYHLFGSDEIHEGEKPNVMPVHLNLKNPKIFTKEEDYEKHVMDGGPDGGLNVGRWIKKGHDGIVYAPNGDMKDPDAYFVAFHPNQIKSAIGNKGTYSKKSGDITKAKGGAVHMDKGGSMEPKKTVKAYKLFRVDQRQPGKLFPLFVHANQPVELDKWHEAQIGEMTGNKVKSKIGPLAFRPGWHAGDLPVATHIGENSDPANRPNMPPDTRPANHVWAEVEMPDDVDWQSVANERGTNAKGRVVPVKAHITDQIPSGGHYRYKTNSNMTGNWLIGGAMKVNRVLDDKEVKAINKAAGVSDLPRAEPFSAKKFGFAGGGSVNKLVIPDHVKNEEIANYRDPKTTKIADWKWRKLKEVLTDVPLTEVPDYIQKGYGEFMNQQLSKAQAGELTPRDLLKAFTITQSSIGRGGLSHASATKTGMKLPNTGEEVRPEGAFAEWLGSSMGQKYLNAAERGLIHHPALGDIQQKFAPFGKHNQLVDQMAYAAQMMPKLAQTMNQAVTGGKDEYRDWAEQMRGIAGAKSGFIGSMLGRGDLPTLDARQLNLHTLPANVGVGSIMSRGKGTGAREAVDRLASRQQAMNLNVDPSMMPHYQHLTHHAVWDAMGKNKTTHDDLVRAMRGYADGGVVHMAGGGKLVKGLGKIAKRLMADDVLPAAERDANLQKFLKPSKVKERMYHGTPNNFNSFAEFPTFLSPDPKFASNYGIDRAQGIDYDASDIAQGASVMPLHVNVKNPFDYENPKHTNALYKLAKKTGIDWVKLDDLKGGSFETLEDPEILGAIQKLGHDGFYVNEGYGSPTKNLGVFRPEQIKSAIGNRGTYDTSDPDITKAEGGSVFKKLEFMAEGGQPNPAEYFSLNDIEEPPSIFERLMIGLEQGGQYIKENALPAVNSGLDAAFPSRKIARIGFDQGVAKPINNLISSGSGYLSVSDKNENDSSEAYRHIRNAIKDELGMERESGPKVFLGGLNQGEFPKPPKYPKRGQPKAHGGRVTHAHHLDIEERPL